MFLIIDADIAKSAGESQHPISSSARSTLDLIKSNDNYRIAFCSTLLGEWKTHKSSYAKRWLATMFAKKRVSILASGTETYDFLSSLNDESNLKLAALKDAHIIDLSIVASKIILSNDMKAKNAFSQFLDKRISFKNIYWVSPTLYQEDVEQFITNKINFSISHQVVI